MNEKVVTQNIFSKTDQKHMLLALSLAEKAATLNEVPVGAVVVDKRGTVIGKGYNQTESLQDASAHAEIIALKEAMQTLGKAQGNWRLNDCVLYCTLEPCVMCLGAIWLARPKKIVWAAPDIRQGACGSFVDLLKEKHPCHTLESQKGLFADKSSKLLKDFFAKRREENKKLK